MRKTVTSLMGWALLGSLLLPSCATILTGTRQSIRISGQPEGSSFYVNNQPVEARPAGAGTVRVRVKRKGSSELKIKHEGYKEYNEVLSADQPNYLSYLNYGLLGVGLLNITSTSDDGNTSTTSNVGPLVIGGLAAAAGIGVDYISGAYRKFGSTEVHALMPRVPKAVAGGGTIQAGPMNVRIKGGDKMGNFYVLKEPQEVLYFGKSFDTDADHLRDNVNGTLKDLGYSVPGSEGRSLFATGSNSRYTLQGEMRDVKYDIAASNKYDSYAHYATTCQVDVTWKLLGPNRQVLAEQKTSGTGVKFEKGGSAAFEDAFENALYAFLAEPQVAAALARPVAKEEDKPAALTLHRGKPARATGENGVGAAAKAVVIVETSDGHGSGCLVSGDGYLVTNAHVVGDESEVKVLLADGTSAKGQVVRVNAEQDLALVKIEAEGLPAFVLPTAGAGAEVGSDVYAIGAPADKELSQTVTKGIISGRRKLEGRTFLQTDVSINGGNSGGALVAHSGQLLGIVNAKLVGQGVEGIGFAIPAEQVADALQLKYAD